MRYVIGAVIVLGLVAPATVLSAGILMRRRLSSRGGAAMNHEQELAKRDRRRHLLARMAGNIAAGLVTLEQGRASNEEIRRAIGVESVAIARAILEELER